MSSIPECPLRPGDDLHGFRVKAVTPVEKLRLVACELEHARTGAHVMHLLCDDAENLFSVSFPTPPSDDTGVPHILEHAVLAGSQRFPVRDPFFEMLKMSMATFINAMTGWDKTYYPVSSNVKQDLFNLAEVYFDAVFHPLLTEEMFQREGHHLAPAADDDPTGKLTINGIVYNEMKAAFSQPEGRLFRLAGRGLFPDTTYGYESGGDPLHIPELTHRELKDFHATLYHPTNAYFIFYGDIPTAEYLAFLAERLAGFERAGAAPEIARQPRWDAPRSARDTYPIGADEDAADKTYLQTDWLVGDGVDPDDVTLLQVLSLVLLGNDAAPLKKAVIDSKLGHDLVFCGSASMGLETTFGVGLKGSEADRADAFRDLVLGTLGELADAGLPGDLVEAAFQQYAYQCREITRMHPLMVMQQVLQAWPYGADPVSFLRMDERLAECRRRCDADPSLLTGLIRERLVDNPHRIDVILAPDREWQARTDAVFGEKMAAVRAAMSDDDARALAEDAEELKRSAGTPNSPEALASLPQLRLEDLPRRPVHIPTSVEDLPSGAQMLANDVFANGVNYLHLNFDLRGLPAELWAWLPRYQETIAKLGAAGMGFEQMTRRKAASTGGVGCGPTFSANVADPLAHAWGITLTLRALDEQIAPALGVIEDLVFSPDPRDADRFEEVLVQTLAHLRTGLVHGATQTALRHAARGLTPEGHLQEVVQGLPQLPLVTGLTREFAAQADGMMEKIEAIAGFLRNSSRVTASFTGSDGAREALRRRLVEWVGRMPERPVEDAAIGFEPFTDAPRFGLAAPIQVSHCAQALPAPHASAPDALLLALGLNMLRVDYMVSEIRFKGNAYGAFCGYDRAGAVVLGSYADPHITRTLGVFAALPDYVQKVEWGADEIRRGIISGAKSGLTPIRPGEATGQALARHLTGETRELREQRYQELLAATAPEVKRALLETFDAGLERSAICVVSSREKLEQANGEMPDAPLAVRDILE